jgi:hypothetical protein
MKKYLITFAAGSINYIEAGERLIKQGNNLKLFDKSILFTDKNLMNDKIFWDKHSDFIQKNKRGFGYWLWKPYIILKTMNELENGDILLYLDSGCEFIENNKDLIIKYFDYVKKDKIIGNEIKTLEGQFSKMDLINYLKLNNENIFKSYQREGGANMFYVNDETRKLVEEWYNIGSEYHFIDDSASKLKNINGFKEHRHDQSIFSLLTKKYNIYSKQKITKIILSSRNRTGFSYNDFLFFIKIPLSNFFSISKEKTNKILINIFIILFFYIIFLKKIIKL